MLLMLSSSNWRCLHWLTSDMRLSIAIMRAQDIQTDTRVICGVRKAGSCLQNSA